MDQSKRLRVCAKGMQQRLAMLLRQIGAALGFALLASMASAAERTLVSFDAPLGLSPNGSVTLGQDGNYYGTTTAGGTYGKGTVFRLGADGTLTTLHSFNGTDGQAPHAELAAGSDGNLYGSTASDNGPLYGTVFRVAPDGTFTTLYSFTDPNGNSSPVGRLVEGADGSFYGLTSGLAANGDGVHGGAAFKISPAGNFTLVHQFTFLEGQIPDGGLMLAPDGNFYGTMQGGGPGGGAGNGTVFQMTPDGVVTVIYDFGYAEAYSPSRLVLGPDGNFYGTSGFSGHSGAGTVFRVTPSGTFANVHEFNVKDGFEPLSGLVVGPDGALYGTTLQGGSAGTPAVAVNSGTVFRITTDGTFTSLHSFNTTDGASPLGALALGPDGQLYGTTAGASGGSGGYGTVFRISTAGTLGNLHVFTLPYGGGPNAPLVADPAGNLLGTAYYGGDQGFGSVFELAAGGSLSQLLAFDGVQAGAPFAGLQAGADGNYYGTTTLGGTGYGTVFMMTPAGAVTVLHAFAFADGTYPDQALLQGADGAFYGTASGGGPGFGGYGTVFRVTAGGTFTVLHAFNNTDGWQPTGRLVQAADGSIYGVTNQGGNGYGTVYRITADGAFTSLYAFNNASADPSTAGAADGANPVGGLTAGVDGNFYGVTQSGTVFRMTPAGALNTIYTFSGGADGAGPDAALLLASDGNLYGTTQAGGADAGATAATGTIFQITPLGALTTLYTFHGSDGSVPKGVVQGSDGNFYGTAAQGGNINFGTLYELDGPPLIPTQLVAKGDAGSVQLTWNASGGATSYSVYMGTGAGGEALSPVQTGITTTSATISGLTGATTYYFYVTAANANGVSLASNEASATAAVSVTATPSFSPPGGDYTALQIVSISDATPGAVIYYTTDGTTPTTASTQYALPVVLLLATTTVEAIAVAPGMAPSSVASATYNDILFGSSGSSGGGSSGSSSSGGSSSSSSSGGTSSSSGSSSSSSSSSGGSNSSSGSSGGSGGGGAMGWVPICGLGLAVLARRRRRFRR